MNYHYGLFEIHDSGEVIQIYTSFNGNDLLRLMEESTPIKGISLAVMVLND